MLWLLKSGESNSIISENEFIFNLESSQVLNTFDQKSFLSKCSQDENIHPIKGSRIKYRLSKDHEWTNANSHD